MHMTSNPVFHEKTKHIKVDYHFGKEKVMLKEISNNSIDSHNQLANIFTKSLVGPQTIYTSNKLMTYILQFKGKRLGDMFKFYR